jgi:hypothetical protein
MTQPWLVFGLLQEVLESEVETSDFVRVGEAG